MTVLNPYSRAFHDDPFPIYRQLRDERVWEHPDVFDIDRVVRGWASVPIRCAP